MDRELKKSFKVSDLTNAFSGPAGKKALGVLEVLFEDRPSYTYGDAHHTAFMEGQRDVVRFIKQQLTSNVTEEATDE